ncbi:hypothetical protein AAIH46_00075 [Rhizobium sp. 0TCS1.26]|uniref:hypothetical protein n=1 Tax=Rhizobium sp. 0TCS1.26 TaxID=3142623 RepID=UPI003D2E60C3
MASGPFDTSTGRAQSLPSQTPQRLMRLTSRVLTAVAFLAFLAYWRQTGGW